MHSPLSLTVLVFLIELTGASGGAPGLHAAEPQGGAQEVKHQITGLFSPDRVDDLREVMQKLPDIKLLSVDFPHAQAAFRYDAAKAFPGAKPEQIVERFNDLLRSASRGTFGVKPLPAKDQDKLTAIEIRVAGLDCKGCAYAAYLAIYQLEGVERAAVSFKEGRVTALIDPAKTTRSKLEAALQQRGVQVASKGE